ALLHLGQEELIGEELLHVAIKHVKIGQNKVWVVPTHLVDGGTSMSPYIPDCPSPGGLTFPNRFKSNT
ncbi:hypothetical protein NL524_31985, partial [Klebsiella pneumoniae]|nr:hypothetical protein [Klebsiella pneumoniae]